MSIRREFCHFLEAKRNTLINLKLELESKKDYDGEMLHSRLSPSAIEFTVKQLIDQSRRMFAFHENHLSQLEAALKNVNEEQLDVQRQQNLMKEYKVWLSSVADLKKAEEPFFEVQPAMTRVDVAFGILKEIHELTEKIKEMEKDLEFMESVQTTVEVAWATLD